MDIGTKERMNEASAEVFGTMYFMPIELLDKAPDESLFDLDSSYVNASIGFSGGAVVTIDFFFPGILARNIAGGFLGIEVSDVSNSQALDTMREAVNMVIGNFLGKIDPEGACKLTIPTAELIEGFSPAALGEKAELLVFESEFGFIWMTYAE